MGNNEAVPMTPRQRVRAVLERKEPDRLPIDCGGTDVTGMHGMAYNAVKKYLNIGNGKTQLFHVYMQLASVEESVRRRLSADVVRLSFEPKQWKASTLPDGSSCEVPEGWNPEKLPDGSEVLMGGDGQPMIKRLPDAAWFSPVGAICPFIQEPKDIPKYAPMLKMLDRSPWIDQTIEDLVERAKKIQEETEYAIAGVFGGHIYAQAQLIRGMDNFMCDLVANETLARALMDTIAESHMAEFEHYIAALDPYLDVIVVNDDLGMQQSGQMSIDMFRSIVKPYLGKLYGFMKSKMTRAKLFLHSCGSVYSFIPDLIEMGVDILNPVQVSAANMDSRKLSSEFGKDIIFWGGGCDTQAVLPRGSTDDVRSEVKRRIDDFASGCGFVFTQVHNIQPGVPPENIVAMYDAALEFGEY
jgi:uroporphyrinogen decarboxylase